MNTQLMIRESTLMILDRGPPIVFVDTSMNFDLIKKGLKDLVSESLPRSIGKKIFEVATKTFRRLKLLETQYDYPSL